VDPFATSEIVYDQKLFVGASLRGRPIHGPTSDDGAPAEGRPYKHLKTSLHAQRS